MPSSSSPAISVIVPTRDRPGMLAVALESLAKQTFHDFEVLVVNDAGVDVSALVERFAQRLSVRLLTHEHLKGVAAARNTGIRAATGKYLAYLDDDDYYFEHHLAALHAFLRNNEYRVAYTNARQDIQELRDGTYHTVDTDTPYSKDFSRLRMCRGNLTPVLCVMHDRACIERSGLFAEYLAAHEDWDFWMRMAQHYEFAHLPILTCAYTTRLDNSSLSTGREDLMRDTWGFTRVQGMLGQQLPAIGSLEQAAASPERLGPERPAPCAVSIVLPLAAIDAQTLKSLAALCAVSGDAQLVLVGSGLGKDVLDPLLQSLAGIVSRPPLALCNAQEIGRIIAANQGAAAATGDWLIFLEEDVQPQAGWIDALTQATLGRKDCGAVGGLLRLPDMAPFAGGTLAQNGSPQFAPLPLHAAAPFHPVQFVSGHCFMIRREYFAALKGFDLAFAPSHYADADLCLRLAHSGLVCGIAAGAQLHWNKQAAPLLQSASGVRSLRLFRDRWAPQTQTTQLDISGREWSIRTRLWPSDGAISKTLIDDMQNNPQRV